MTLFLGTHQPHWLRFSSVPLFVSYLRLRDYRNPPQAHCYWAEDSGGFSELSIRGRWTVEPARYADAVTAHMERPGLLCWAAIQDWMCEPFILGQTGKTIREHQDRTIESYLTLRSLAPRVPWAPVLQGWTPGDYVRHHFSYAAAGIDLRRQPVVGVGSVCRRQGMTVAEDIFRCLRGLGLRLHGFGLKITGLRTIAPMLASADSMAWSFEGRRSPPLPGHTHKNCANCYDYALRWMRKVRRVIKSGPPALRAAKIPPWAAGAATVQPRLFD
jgi:hypothetical protein